jgi:hypothetical protein
MRTPRKMQRRIKTMREILFRAKAINRVEGREYRTNYKNGDWVYGLLSKPYIEVGEYSSAAEMTNTSGISDIEVDHETIGQFTGLTDKNGVKIFEGDIVEYEGKRYSINYLPHYTRFSAVKPNTVFCVFAYQRGEVIGNIYDNPELI